MSKYSNTIEYKLKTSADLKGIQDLQKSLTQVTNILESMQQGTRGLELTGLQDSVARVQQLQDALTKTFNPKMGMINGEQLQKEIGNIGINTLISDLNKAGASGQIAINNLIGGLGRVHTNLNTISGAIDKVVNTFGNTVRWGITASIFETMSNNLRRSVEFVRDLDTSLNNIQIVSGQSSEQMKSFAEWASQAGQNLGRSTIDIVDAAQIFAQNGFNVEDQKKLAELTNEVANVTQQSSETASSQITSLMNGYKLSIDEAKDALDAMALVAAESASDLNELATAETRVASVAHDLGVSQNQLTAQLSTMVSVTRQAPETVGNALRSIYARIGDLKLGGSDETGVDLGKVSGALSEIGINVLDANGDMREMGTIIEELMEKWNDLGRAQQQALAITVAGKQQVNMFQTLMSNADMYRETLETAEGAIGTLDAQQEIYMDSAVAKMQTLSTAGEELVNSLFNADNYKPTLDVLTDFVNILTNVVDSLGGGLPVLTAFTSMFLKLGNREIGSVLGDFIFNKNQNIIGARSDAINQQILEQLNGDKNNSLYQFTQDKFGGQRVTKMNEADQQEYNKLLEEGVKAENALAAAKENYHQALVEIISEENKSNELKKAGVKLTINEAEEIEATATIDFPKELEVLQSLKSMLGDVTAGVEGLDEALDPIEENLKRDVEKGSQLAKIIDEIILDLRTAPEGDTSWLLKLNKAIKTTKGKVENQEEQLRAATDDDAVNERKARTRNERGAYNESKTEVEGQKTARKLFEDSQQIKNQTQNILHLVDGINSLVFVLQSLNSLNDIVNDKTLTNTEKFDKIITNLVSSAPMLVMGLKDMKEGFGAFTDIVKIFGKTDFAKGLLKTLGNHFEIFKEASIAAQAGTLGFGASLGALAAPIAAAIAGIAALVLVIKSIYDEVHKFDIALEEANENLSNARQNTEKAQNKLSELKAGLEEVKNTKDSFEGLKQGTVEWTDALIKANEQVLKLIETYPELAQYIATDSETGSLSFTEEGMQKVLENQMQTVANNQAIQAQAILDQARAENEKLAHDTNITWNSGVTGYAYGTGTSTARTLTDNQKMQAATMLATNPGANAKDLLDAGLVTSIEDGNKLLESNREALIELGNEITKNTEAAKSESEARIQSALSLDESYQKLSDNEKEFVNQLVSRDFNEDSDRYKEVVNSINELTEAQQKQRYQEITSKTDEEMQGISSEQIKEGLISAGIISAITENGNGLKEYIAESQRFTESLVSTFGEAGANAFNLSDKSFNFEGIKFTDYLNLKELNLDEIDLSAFAKLGEMSEEEFRTGFEEALKNVDFDTMDMRLNGELEDQIYNLQDTMAETLKNIRKDTELTADNYRVFLSESLQESLDAVKISSESVGSVYELLEQSSLDAERAIYGMNEVLNEQQHSLQLADVEWLAGQYDSLTEHAQDSLDLFNELNENSKIELRLDYEEVEDAYNELMSLYDLANDLENQTFSLGIDIGADLQDSSNDIIDVLEDIVDATSSVDEGFKIAADDVEDFAKAFPGILEDYTVTADGLIQLNESVVQSTLGVASVDAKSVAEAQKSKLKNYAEYASIMKNAYQKRAEEIYRLAEEETKTDAEAKQIRAENDRLLAEEAIKNAEKLGINITTVSKEVESTTDETNENIADQFSAMTESADKNITNLGTNAISTFEKMAKAALEVAEAIEVIGKENASEVIKEKIESLKEEAADPTSFEAYQKRVQENYKNTYKPKSTSEDREQAQAEHIAEISGASKLYTEEEKKELESLFKSGNDTLKNYAEELEAKAGAWETMENSILADMAKIEAKSIEISSSIDKVGQEDSDKFKSTKEKEKAELEKPEDIKKLDYLEDEPDRYERINTVLEKIANQYSRIADEQDRLAGNQYAENIAKQLNLLQQQIKAEEHKLSLQKQETEELKSNLEAQGVQFDEEGFITNYQSMYSDMQDNYNEVVDAYDKAQREAQDNYIKELNTVKETQATIINELIEQYNNAKPGSNEEKSLKEQITKAKNSASESEKAIEEAYETLKEKNKKYYEELLDTSKTTLSTFKTDIERYDQLYSSEMEETMNKMEEYQNKIEDLQIEAFRKSVDVGSNIKEIQETMVDINTLIRTISRGKDPIASMASSAEKLSYYWNSIDGNKGYFELQAENMEKLTNLIDQYKSTGSADYYGENGAALYEDAKKSLDEAKSLLSDYESEIGNLESAISEFFNLIIKKIDATMDKFDLFNEKLEHYISLINMTWGDKSSDALITLYDNVATNAGNQIETNKRLIESYREMQQAFTQDQDEWWTLEDKINSTISNIYDLQEQQVEAINKKLEAQNKKIIDQWEKSLLNGQTIDDYADQWEIINRNSEQYLDAIESAYELQKLQNKYQDLANNGKSVNTQNKILNAMQEQLKNLQGQTKLSQYQVDYANAQYDILQKTIALEEARNNKNQMKLRRDRQGNYSYVYSADEEDTQEKTEMLMDAQQKAYELSKQYLVSTQENIISVLQQSKAAIEDILNDTTLTVEEKDEKIKFITDNLQEYLMNESQIFKLAQINIVWDSIATVQNLSVTTTEEFNEIMADLTKSAIQQIITTSDLTEEQQEAKIKALLSQMRTYLGDSVVTFVDTNGQYVTTSVNNLQDFNNMSTSSFLEVMRVWSKDCNNAFTKVDKRWESSTYSWLDNLQIIKDGNGNLVFNWETSTNKIILANDNLKQNAINAYNAWYQAVNQAVGYIIGDIGQVSDEIEDTTKQTAQLKEAADNFFDGLEGDIDTLKVFIGKLEDYRQKTTELQGTVSEFAKLCSRLADELIAKQQEYYDINDKIIDQLDSINSSANQSNYSSSGSSTGSNTQQTQQSTQQKSNNQNNSSGQRFVGPGSRVGYHGVYYENSWGEGRQGNYYADQPNAVKISAYSGVSAGGNQTNTGDYDVHLEDLDGGALGWVKKSQLFDSGGYTGKWDDGMEDSKNGKLAVLHEKELVLNASDTENILQAVNIMRQTLSEMSSIDFNKMNNIDFMTGRQDVNQNIQIEANFPNVTNENEIRNALLNLTSNVAQFAHRQK